jgi:hypothetical protein
MTLKRQRKGKAIGFNVMAQSMGRPLTKIVVDLTTGKTYKKERNNT